MQSATHLPELHCTGENIDILHRSPSSASQGHWHGWISITNPAVTLYFLFLLCDNQLSLLLFLQFPTFMSPSLPCILPASLLLFVLILTFSHSLTSTTWGFYILKEKMAGADRDVPHRHRNLTENPTLTSILSLLLSLPFALCSEELQRAVGEAGLWLPGDHQRTSQNTQTSTEPAKTGPQYGGQKFT